MDFSLWIAFVAASAALLVLPGPTVLLVLSYAVSRGKAVALATVGGVALGDLLAMSASLAGIGAILLASASLFVALKWIGALYLIYLGIRLIRSAAVIPTHDAAVGRQPAARRVFGHAAAVTALNPKSIVFFVAFLPQFVNAEAPLLPQFAILVATFVGLATLNALAYALLADRLRRRMTRPAAQEWLSRLGGGALIAMGIATLAVRRQ